MSFQIILNETFSFFLSAAKGVKNTSLFNEGALSLFFRSWVFLDNSCKKKVKRESTDIVTSQI
ncbi:MAG: hypothetical protein CSA20_05605 [Deltaproteobacteria bacterium]|nr:MAG: hypothetical protein CSA20_05605 [Deltaproteobacteria bacterium]